MAYYDIIGIIAACLTSTAMYPQVYKGLKTRKANDVSWMMLSVLLVGTLLWLAYGGLKGDWILFWANAVGFTSLLMLLGVKILYGRN